MPYVVNHITTSATHPAFCKPSLLRLSTNATSFATATHTSFRRKCTPAAAAYPPRRIGAVAKDLQQALQSSLQSRTSRISVTLPPGARLGTEERSEEKDETPDARRIGGDRELARILAGMFERTGLLVRVLFATEKEVAEARRAWGPAIECEVGVLGSLVKKGKARVIAGKKLPKKVGFNSSNRSGGGSEGGGSARRSEEELEVDVFVAVGGGAGFMDKVRTLAQQKGMDKLVIVANGNSSNDTMAVDLQRYYDDEFEAVYYYRVNPHPKCSKGILFRKFPDGKFFAFVLVSTASLFFVQQCRD